MYSLILLSFFLANSIRAPTKDFKRLIYPIATYSSKYSRNNSNSVLERLYSG
jgi:hypothetical protein